MMDPSFYSAKARSTYSSKMIKLALLLAYTSAQAYKILLKEFSLPPFSLLKRLKHSGFDAMKALTIFLDRDKTPRGVVLMADEFYL